MSGWLGGVSIGQTVVTHADEHQPQNRRHSGASSQAGKIPSRNLPAAACPLQLVSTTPFCLLTSSMSLILCRYVSLQTTPCAMWSASMRWASSCA